MDLNDLQKEWNQKKVPAKLDSEIMRQMGSYDAKVKKENLKISYWLAGTVYVTGFVALPLLHDINSILSLAAIWLLIGVQAILFWLRNSNVKQSMVERPEAFLQAKISKLKYDLMVTNVFVPIYMLLLGLLSNIYLVSVLKTLDKSVLITIILCNCTFYILMFLLVWIRQRKNKMRTLLPQIVELESIKKGLEL